MNSAIEIRLLGPLEVEHSGERIQLEGVKQRRLFVLLALRAPEAVSNDDLLEALWGDEVPAGAIQALHQQISRLRRQLGEGPPLRHRPAGYSLEIDPQAIDSHRFEQLLDRARVELGRDEPAPAAADLREALALWRGEALADHRFDEFAQREIARLEELRVEAIEDRLAADLACGRDSDVIGELSVLVAEHPLRERLRAQLMLALYPGRPASGGARDDALGPSDAGGRAWNRTGAGATAIGAHDPRPRSRAVGRVSRWCLAAAGARERDRRP